MSLVAYAGWHLTYPQARSWLANVEIDWSPPLDDSEPDILDRYCSIITLVLYVDCRLYLVASLL
jgi:hypothetical protein